jgi:5,5'-dehydrodivanillate O-demethylase
MPNKQHIKDTFSERDNLIWKVPIDDENTAHLRVTVVKGADAIEKEKAKLAQRQGKPQLNGFQLAKEVLAGRLRPEDVDPTTTEMVYFEDHIALLAQGVIADRENEFLGASDTPIVLLRNLWEREMRALAEGRPLKQWSYDTEEMSQAIRRAE